VKTTANCFIQLLTSVCVFMSLPSTRRAGAAADWTLYHNVPTGLTFRYPPSMHVVEKDPRRSSLSPIDALVQLVDASGSSVLRFQLNHGNDTINSIGTECKPMRLGGTEAAFECVECMPACFWHVEVVTPRSCSIDAGKPPPLQDAEFPYRSIIETVKFEDQAASVTPTDGDEVESTGNALGAGIFVTNYNTQKTRNVYSGNLMTAYGLANQGAVRPFVAIKMFNYGRGIALDSRGRIVVANVGSEFTGWTSIAVYPADAKEDSAPIMTISGVTSTSRPDLTALNDPNGIALDSIGNIYVTTDFGTLYAPHSPRLDGVIVYPAGGSGNVKPGSMISGADTGLRDPYGIAVDSSGIIYVANFQGGASGTGSVTTYRAGSDGTAKPISTIAGPDTGLYDPSGVAVDCRGNIYVANYEGGLSRLGSVTIYKRGSDGDAKPSATIVGGATGLRQPYGLALDADRNIYVANYMGGPSHSGSITVYRGEVDGDVAPTTTITGPTTGLAYPWAIGTRPYQCAGHASPVQQPPHL
jgi:sugar lactone lactonase YvrE